MSINDRLMALGVDLAERGIAPDLVIRRAMRQVIGSRLRSVQQASGPAWETEFNHQIAEATDEANEQHYEVPPEFFSLVLGPRLKYSSGYWPAGVTDLAGSEEAMLALYGERARLEDGLRILDLGSGWGSFSLWAAEKYPNALVTAVSNSRPQGEFIGKKAAGMGLDNVRVETADINTFQPGMRFDRIVSIEMLEHVRNHALLFSRIREWLDPGGLLFTHVFAHQQHSYSYETEGPANWMARTFFTGGVMPSRSLLPDAARPHFTKDGEWWVSGEHYAATCEAWLEKLDSVRGEVENVLEKAYGSADVDRWVQRWRMFFMACAELFAYDEGRQWGVVHQAFRPSESDR